MITCCVVESALSSNPSTVVFVPEIEHIDKNVINLESETFHSIRGQNSRKKDVVDGISVKSMQIDNIDDLLIQMLIEIFNNISVSEQNQVLDPLL